MRRLAAPSDMRAFLPVLLAAVTLASPMGGALAQPLEFARSSTGAEGGVGVLRTPSTVLGNAGTLRLGLVGEGFAARDFPVLGGRTRHAGGRLTLDYVPLPWLETFLTLGGGATFSNRSSPPGLQTLGELVLGAKGVWRLPAGFQLGLEARFREAPAARREPGRYAPGFEPRLLVGFDGLRTGRPFPLRVHLAAGARLTWNPLLDPFTLRAAEEYALDAHRFHRFVLSAAAEVPLPWLTPFVEYGVAVPLRVPGGRLISPDGSTLTPSSAMAQTLGFGLKIPAGPVTLLAASELGLNRRVGLGFPAVPPFQFLLGASLGLDLVPRVCAPPAPPPVAVAPAPRTRVVEGVVIDAESGVPLGDARIDFPGTSLPPVATAPTGLFRTHALEGREAQLVVSSPGHAESPVTVPLASEKPATITVPLAPLAPTALVALHVTGDGKPVDARVRLTPAAAVDTARDIDLPADSPAEVVVEVKPGLYSAAAVADGFLAQTRDVQLAPRTRTPLAFTLVPAPKKPLVALKGNKLELSQAVHFATGKTRILADSFSLLDQVVDALVKNAVGKVRIEGHTDNQGSAAFNLKLSQGRADAVADYLVSKGIDRNRLETQGFGGTRPVAPNLTARGRELNRRVEFVVVRREGPGAPAP